MVTLQLMRSQVGDTDDVDTLLSDADKVGVYEVFSWCHVVSCVPLSERCGTLSDSAVLTSLSPRRTFMEKVCVCERVRNVV